MRDDGESRIRAWPKGCLVTSFRPFRGRESNASEPYAEALARALEGELGVGVKRALLPVSWDEARAFGPREVAPERLVVMFGEGMPGGPARLESAASNRWQRRDVFGRFYGIEPALYGQGERVLRTALDVERLAAHVRSGGPGAESGGDESAGDYVCNAIYYHALQAAERAPGARVLFVHVPLEPPGPDYPREFCAALARAVLATP